jgi:transcriptional regulatory protein LevR
MYIDQSLNLKTKEERKQKIDFLLHMSCMPDRVS